MNDLQTLKNWAQDQIDGIEADDRYQAPLATIDINAPLALIQLSMSTKRDTLKSLVSKIEEIENEYHVIETGKNCRIEMKVMSDFSEVFSVIEGELRIECMDLISAVRLFSRIEIDGTDK